MKESEESVKLKAQVMLMCQIISKTVNRILCFKKMLLLRIESFMNVCKYRRAVMDTDLVRG